MRIILQIRSFLFALLLLSLSAAAFAQIGISISFAPPELPVYEQPLCPGDGYLWTPGYWAYANDIDDYYWVPGTWVMAPEIGFLWTPAYWGWGGNGYIFYDGYWGPHVGFYGGISYGYGYFGEGYEGGRWDNGHFFYNRSVNNVNITEIHNVYNTTVINSNTVNRVSYNGGNGGISARPRPEDEAAARDKHIPAVAVQTQHAQAARTNPEQRASVNHGKPAIAATPKPGAFSDRAVVPAKAAGAPYNPPANRAAVQPAANAPAAHPVNNAARPTQTNNQPETNRPAAAQPNPRSETNRPAAAQPNPRVEPNQPAERPQTSPASERSQPQRTSPTPAETRPAPQQEQHSQPAARANHHGPEDFVFWKEDGSPLNPDVLRRDVLYPALDRLGIARTSRAAGFHTFRHSAATIVNQKTGNLKLVQKLLGHSNLSTTADVYTHTSVDADRSATLALEEAIFGDLFQVVPRFGTGNKNAAAN